MIRGRVFLEGFFKVLISNQILIYLFVLDENFQLWRVLEEVQQEAETIATYGEGA